MITLRQIRSVVAVAEEGSFTKAAARENATQSGVSQHVAAVEAALGVTLFERSREQIRPTPAGAQYYVRALEVLRGLETAAGEARVLAGGVAGRVRAGLMPAFTRVALPPALESFSAAHPAVSVEVIEGYSGQLTDMVRRDDLDFALVPAGAGGSGLTVRHLMASREMLVSGPSRGLDHGADVRLADLGPLHMILPSAANVRRARLESYFETHGVTLGRVLEMDTMLGTLGLVARSDWVTVLPALICAADAAGAQRRLHQITGPDLWSDFVVIEPARRPMPPQAALFLEALRQPLAGLGEVAFAP